jgi:hypothetical protein
MCLHQQVEKEEGNSILVDSSERTSLCLWNLSAELISIVKL